MWQFSYLKVIIKAKVATKMLPLDCSEVTMKAAVATKIFRVNSHEEIVECVN